RRAGPVAGRVEIGRNLKARGQGPKDQDQRPITPVVAVTKVTATIVAVDMFLRHFLPNKIAAAGEKGENGESLPPSACQGLVVFDSCVRAAAAAAFISSFHRGPITGSGAPCRKFVRSANSPTTIS